MKFKKPLKNIVFNLNPPSLLALGFLCFIIVGTLLLKLPVSHYGNISWMDALFTATSAVTITGLSVVNIGDTYTSFGQMTVLLLIQLGGLGFMTFAILAALSLSPKLGLKQNMLVQDTLGQTSLSNVMTIIQTVFFYSLFFEFLGFIILASQWIPYFGFEYGTYYALFYSISAFNNAGFSLFSDSLMSFHTHPTIYWTISSLYILGGIGFLVLLDISRKRSWRKLNPNSKLVLTTILILNIFSFLMIWGLEATNPLTLKNFSFSEQITHAWFQATVPRSSGFNSIDTGSMTDASTFITMLLMLIGGGSLSTAGGIKIGTFVILVISVISFLRRNDEVTIFNHSVPQQTVIKALAVTFITCTIISIGIFILLLSEKDKDIIDIMFEVISAACTVGLSRGITSELHDGSLFILCLLMFAGRLGPLTLAYLIATPKKSKLKHAQTEIQIG